jgi:hypothetical protein
MTTNVLLNSNANVMTTFFNSNKND